MTWAPKGPYGSIIHEEDMATCDGCGFSIRSENLSLLDAWLLGHDCNEPEAWEPDDPEDDK